MASDVIVLAAGKGSRMKSNLPKVLHKLAGKTLLGHVLGAVQGLGKVHVVVGHKADEVRGYASQYGVNFAVQAEQNGTGHAVQCAMHALDSDKTLVVLGDVPLLRRCTLNKLLSTCQTEVGLLTLALKNPTGYGRIVRNRENEIEAIVEQKDCSAAQLKIAEVNTGIMVFNTQRLKEWLPRLQSNNASGEFYLTDVIAMAKAEGVKVQSYTTDSAWEVAGVNTPEQLAELEKVYFREGLNASHEPAAKTESLAYRVA